MTSSALDFRFDLNRLRLDDDDGVDEGAVGVVGSGWVIAVDGSVIGGGMVALLDESLASTSKKVSLPISVLNIIKCS